MTIGIHGFGDDLALGGNDLVQQVDGLVRALDHRGVILAAEAHGEDAFVILVACEAVAPEFVEDVGVSGVVPWSAVTERG